MIHHVVALFIAFMIGGTVGIFVTAMCTASKWNTVEEDEYDFDDGTRTPKSK